VGVRPPDDALTAFRDGHAYLSNFYPSSVQLDGITYRTVEHAFQAAKTLDKKQRIVIEQMATPQEAKRFGRAIELRENWDEIKFEIMRVLLAQKFEDRRLRAKLLKTHPRLLIEGNRWGDTIWGMDLRTWEGQNHLGELLMAIRDGIWLREVWLK